MSRSELVGSPVGAKDGCVEGDCVCISVGTKDGWGVGDSVGLLLGPTVGYKDGSEELVLVGEFVGSLLMLGIGDGYEVGPRDGEEVVDLLVGTVEGENDAEELGLIVGDAVMELLDIASLVGDKVRLLVSVGPREGAGVMRSAKSDTVSKFIKFTDSTL